MQKLERDKPYRGVMDGNGAVVEAVRLCDVQVIAAYPITPQSHISEGLAKAAANGEIDSEYIKVESEHSAMSACIGASATGTRVFSATASQGLALMHEMLFAAAGLRLPIVLVNCNRALSAPLNIQNDQQDSITERDSGWIQLYCETAQESLDTTVQAYKIAENPSVMLPVMVCLDGFVLTHTVEPVDVPGKDTIKKFLPDFDSKIFLNPKKPMTIGAFAGSDSYTEFRHENEEAIQRSLKVIKDVDKEYGKLIGRGYGLIEEYKTDNADVILITLGSVAGTIKEVIDESEYGSTGLIRVKCYRPFPKNELLKALSKAKVVAVIEKDISLGLGEGALYSEIKGLLYNSNNKPKALNFIVGLGGRDVTSKYVKEIIYNSNKALDSKVQEVTWVGLKEEG
jgi:pyruvate ferredoxin oxidoreductase alpha subunit|tara:strand:- start:1747 stop:2940 length:1194 start_codon:yes stop_codon:yes gene_type:complete